MSVEAYLAVALAAVFIGIGGYAGALIIRRRRLERRRADLESRRADKSA